MINFNAVDLSTSLTIEPPKGTNLTRNSVQIQLTNLIGTSGDDTIEGSLGNTTLNGLGGNDYLVGGTGHDTLLGEAGHDSIFGRLGNDYLEGGTGNDSMFGGNGVYPGHVLYLQSSQAISNIVLPEADNDTLMGGDGNDHLYGEDGNDHLEGGRGNDQVIGEAGHDYLYGNAGHDYVLGGTGNDVIFGGDGVYPGHVLYLQSSQAISNVFIPDPDGNDTLIGGEGNDQLHGQEGNDYLDGGVGNDSMYGETGNDTYLVDSKDDVIIEQIKEGTDTVNSSLSYTLGANLENLTLTGTAPISGTGNALNNFIKGNSANNVLNGGLGIDTLEGGKGKDLYIVDSTNDTIIEQFNEGIDTVDSSVTYSLRANIEILNLTGKAAINGTGNGLNNLMVGNLGNNHLDGGTGNDHLRGRTGKDTLTGGVGVDKFDYKALEDSLLSNYDIITDFNATAGNDLFLVNNARPITAFNNVGPISTLDEAAIAAVLTPTSFGINSAAQFQVGSNTFVALNNQIAGFNANTDAIIQVTGLTGTLSVANFTTIG